MPELAQENNLYPALLDRLIDEAPDQRHEPNRMKVVTARQLCDMVKRDLIWLLNTINLRSVQDLDLYPEVASSVLNYGIPDVTGHVMEGWNLNALETSIKQAIIDFEPRIIKNTIDIRIVGKSDLMPSHTLQLEIDCDIWGEPAPEHLSLRTSIDLETGDVQLRDSRGF